MPKRIKAITTSVTNTQIMLATAAAFLANGLALIAVPAVSKAPIKVVGRPLSCTAQITASSRSCTLRKDVTGYRSFAYRCPNGTTFKVNASCLSQASLQKIANENCLKRKHCTDLNPVVQAPRLREVQPMHTISRANVGYGYNQGIFNIDENINQNSSDLAFLGRPEENVVFYKTPEGVAKIKVRYTNRGPAALPESANVPGGTEIIVTFLNDNQVSLSPLVKPLSAPLAPLSFGQSFEQEFIVPEQVVKMMGKFEIRFIKVELRVGNREIGGEGSFDQDILNNTLITEAPAKFVVMTPVVPVLPEKQ